MVHKLFGAVSHCTMEFNTHKLQNQISSHEFPQNHDHLTFSETQESQYETQQTKKEELSNFPLDNLTDGDFRPASPFLYESEYSSPSQSPSLPSSSSPYPPSPLLPNSSPLSIDWNDQNYENFSNLDFQTEENEEWFFQSENQQNVEEFIPQIQTNSFPIFNLINLQEAIQQREEADTFFRSFFSTDDPISHHSLDNYQGLKNDSHYSFSNFQQLEEEKEIFQEFFF